MKSARPTAGFTLLELVVVIAVMAVVATLIGVGLSRGSDASALEAGQSLLQSQLNAARAQAALHGEETALVVADASTFGRAPRVVGVVIKDEESETWRAISDSVSLPEGVGVLGPAEGSTLWKETLSVAFGNSSRTIECWAVRLAPHGGLASGGGGELWLALGQLNERGWTRDADSPERGIRVSRYGAVERIERAGGEQP